MRAISTYSGECGGLGYAAELVGMEVAVYCEADPKRRAQLAAKHPGKPIFESDTELTKDAIDSLGIHADILFGGPPCQPFSVAGTRRGTADSRHRWPEMLRFIREYRPRWVLVENVGGFVHLALDLVCADLEAEGYEVGAVVLPALSVGAPHRRDRCFVVGYTQRGGCARNNGRRSSAQPEGRCGDGVEHAGRTGREEHHIATVTDDAGYHSGRPAESGAFWTDQSAICRDFDGIPNRLHEVIKNEQEIQTGNENLQSVIESVSNRLDEQMSHWPAWRGQEQYDWEPPRTGLKIPDRPRRIESLGLAVVPWQVYPIMALIKEMDGILREEST